MSRYSRPKSQNILSPKQIKFDEFDDSSTDSSDEESADNLLQNGFQAKESKETWFWCNKRSRYHATRSTSDGTARKQVKSTDAVDPKAKDLSNKERIVLCRGRIAVTRRQLGIAGAAVNGLWGANNLIPLHYAAKEGFGGAGYLISYATGSLLVNTVMWLFYFMYYVYDKNCSIREAYESLPSFHIRELGAAGILAGLLYSTGNFASIMAVSYLGQGVGYSFCQSSILVSGLWGIFFFKEITGRETVVKWLLSAVVTVVGIIWLSYEHQSGATAH